MTPQLWIAVVFAAVLVGFFMVAYFTGGNMTLSQQNILRFLAATCAGCFGGFLSGDLIIRYEVAGPAGNFALSATAGIALFVFIWWTWHRAVPMPSDAFHFALGKGWTFEQAVKAIAGQDNAVVSISGFNQEQLKSELAAKELHCLSPKQAIEQLRTLDTSGSLPGYSVRRDPEGYHVNA